MQIPIVRFNRTQSDFSKALRAGGPDGFSRRHGQRSARWRGDWAEDPNDGGRRRGGEGPSGVMMAARSPLYCLHFTTQYCHPGKVSGRPERIKIPHTFYGCFEHFPLNFRGC